MRTRRSRGKPVVKEEYEEEAPEEEAEDEAASPPRRSNRKAPPKKQPPPPKATRSSPRAKKNVKKELKDDETLTVEGEEDEESMQVSQDSDRESAQAPPVREIHTRHSKNLDEPTLGFMKDFLSKHKGDPLDDDEVIQLTNRMNRLANSQATYHQAMLSGRCGPYESDEESDDSSLFAECLAEEEEHALGNEFFKRALASAEPKRKDDMELEEEGKADPKIVLDKKTLLFLKKASGIHRSMTGQLLNHTKLDNNDRRLTRQQARDSRLKKRERGLDILVSATNDLEDDFGPFPVRRPRRPRRYDDVYGKRKRRQSRFLEEYKRHHKRRLSTGKHSSHREMRPIKRLCTDLQKLSFQWREKTLHLGYPPVKRESIAEFLSRELIPLHPQFVGDGVVHRFPRLKNLDSEEEKPGVVDHTFSPPRVRHSDSEYAVMCCRVMNSIVGGGRLFATAEWFYSDIDLEWYNERDIAEKLATMGVPLHTKISLKEWRVLRRKIQGRPRRFSRNFIASEVEKRNKYRSTVRILQNNPHLASKVNFPYNVYSPIRVGTTVTALCHRYKSLQRGRVLIADVLTGQYLIEFENKLFGYAICPDTEVATSGGPTVLLARAETSPPPIGELDVGSATMTTHAFQNPKYLTKEQHFKNLINGRRFGISQNRDGTRDESSFSAIPIDHIAIHQPRLPNGAVVNDIVNNDTFLSLLATIDKAKWQKKSILELLKDASSMNVDQLPFGDSSAMDTSTDGPKLDEANIVWLQENLKGVNHVLRTAMGYLRSLYGPAYQPDLPSFGATDSARSFIDSCINEGKNDLALQTGKAERAHAAKQLETLATKVGQESTPEGIDNSAVVSERLASSGEVISMALIAKELGASCPWISDELASFSKTMANVDLPSHADEKYIGALNDHKHAMDEFKAAVAALSTEVDLAELASIPREGLLNPGL